MIRTFIKSIVGDLANAVARSELAAENARLRAKVRQLEVDDARQAHLWAKDVKELADAKDQLRDLRARLEAAENERDHVRANYATAVIENKRRSPVDRSAAIEAANRAVASSRWGGSLNQELTRAIVDAILGAQKEAPAEKLTTAEAVAHICRELQSDPGYRIAWVANIAMQFKDRLAKAPFIIDEACSHKLANEAAEGFIEFLCKGAPRPTREAPAGKPAALVPAETSEEPSAELVEQMATAGHRAFAVASGCPHLELRMETQGRQAKEKAAAMAIYTLIARDHAAATKRVGELEKELGTERAMKEGCQNRLRALAEYVRRAGATQEDDCGDTVEKARLTIERLKLDLARLSAPCPADGMSDEAVGLAIRECGDQAEASMPRFTDRDRSVAWHTGLVASGAKARELFGRAAK